MKEIENEEGDSSGSSDAGSFGGGRVIETETIESMEVARSEQFIVKEATLVSPATAA